MKLKRVVHGETGEHLGYVHWCQGCQRAHIFYVPRWNFNGNMDKPTFTPSMRLYDPASDGKPERTICHYFLTDGEINYLNDCTEHQLRGKHPLQDFPANYGVP